MKLASQSDKFLGGFNISKSKSNSIKKTIRFDKLTFDFVNDIANAGDLSFSLALKFALVMLMRNGYDKDASLNRDRDISNLSSEDKRLLHQVLILYSRSSSNINQSTHALNQLKNLSWLDINHDDLMDRLDRIYLEVNKVNQNFDNYQDVLSKLSKYYDRNQ